MNEPIDVGTYQVGVMVGRFQVDAPHEEHRRIIEMMLERHPYVLLVVGCNHVGSTRRNRLSFADRAFMLKEHFPSPRVMVMSQRDVPNNNELWSYNLDKLIDTTLAIGWKALLYGSRDSFIPRYRGKHKTFEVKSESDVSGTSIRNSISSYLPEGSAHRNYLRGLLAKDNQSYPLHPTAVDTVVWDRGCNSILLIRKKGDEQYRILGGFCDGKTRYELDGVREAKEETGVVVKEPKPVGTFLVDKDERYLHEEEKIISLLQVAEYVTGVNGAYDDVQGGDSEWWPICAFEWPEGEAPLLDKYNLGNIRPLHREMMEAALDWIKRELLIERLMKDAEKIEKLVE